MSRAATSQEVTVHDLFPDLDNQSPHVAPDILEPYFWEVFEHCRPYTCLTVERFYNLYKSIEYIAFNNILGDIVECGVFLGGSIIGAALFAEHFGIGNRKIYLYDTFEGFPLKSEDTDLFGNTYDLSELPIMNQNFRAVVEANIIRSGLDPNRFILRQGYVEEVLIQTPHSTPISMLRLDTDYYESTLVELEKLYPLVSGKGVLIIDDYGHFKGARQAVDEYFAAQPYKPLLQRIDYTGRCCIKPA